MIEDAYRLASGLGLAVWCADQAGPFQTVPHTGRGWRPEGRPARLPHEYIRNGTAKVLTLFHPATGHVRLKGVTSCPNAVLHPWLKQELTAVLAGRPDPPPTADRSRAAWERWQVGLKERITLPAELPTLRVLLVLDNRAGHRTPDFVLWLFAHGVMPVYTATRRVVVEHGREHPTDLDGPGPERAGADPPRPNHRVVRVGGRPVECRPDAVRVGRKAGSQTEAAPRAAPGRRVGGNDPAAGPQREWPRPSQLTH